MLEWTKQHFHVNFMKFLLKTTRNVRKNFTSQSACSMSQLLKKGCKQIFYLGAPLFTLRIPATVSTAFADTYPIISTKFVCLT